VLAEIGIDAATGAVAAPKTKVAQKQSEPQGQEAESTEDADIDRLLQQLRS
jgi:hypothetical protein